MTKQTHLPCPDCGSSDALQVNPDGSTYCHSGNHVGKRYKPNGLAGMAQELTEDGVKKVAYKQTGKPLPISSRSLLLPTIKKYGVTTTDKSYSLPYYSKDNKPVGSKERSRQGKEFWSSGSIQSGMLFGQQAFPSGCARYITLTEGEFDAMSVYQMQDGYPAVSIKNGAAAALKECKEQYEYLDSFEQVVVCFDNDEPGQKAAQEVCALFGGKARNVVLAKHKDANEYLTGGDAKAFNSEWWNAPVYVPSGLIEGSQLHDTIMSDPILPVANWPWDGMNLITYGIRAGELITVTAGTGTGKSTFVKQTLKHIMSNTDVKMGVISLEEQTKDAALGIMSMAANKRLHIYTKDVMQEHVLNDPGNIIKKPSIPDRVTKEELEQAFNDTLASKRFMFMESKGHYDVNSVYGDIKYMVKVWGASIILLDHISMLVVMEQSKGGRKSERECIDIVMHDLASLVNETGATIMLVCHLSRKGKGVKAHEEGGAVGLSDLRGSQSIAQYSHLALALERDQQAEQEALQNITHIRVLKNRFAGETGQACTLQYNTSTGLLNEIDTGEEPL